ncbi:MAG: phosphoribosylanthranilate isomerase [Acidimicrobiales bacterium]
MREPWSRGYVKVCGVTSVENSLEVVAAGVDAIGVNLATSPRRVTPDQARAILDATRGSVLRCGVFADNEDEEISACANALDFDILQIHGPLGPALHDDLRRRGVRIVKALNIESEEFSNFDDGLVDAVLVDGPRPGSGAEHSWDGLGTRVFRVPIIAAGGLTPQNVGKVIFATRAWGVDCASGVESQLGVKDSRLVQEFVTSARTAWPEEEESWR